VGDNFPFSADIQNPSRQGPVQPAVREPALTGGLDQMTPEDRFQPLPLYDSVY